MTDRKVVELAIVSRDGEPDPDIVQAAKDFLAECEAGKVVAFALAYKDDEGCANNVFVCRANAFFMLGAICRMKERIMVWLDGLQQ